MHDLIILGGGAAALAAGAYSLDKQLDMLLIAAEAHGKAGTQQHIAHQVGEEHLGGAAAVQLFRQQVWSKLGVVLRDAATRVSYEGDRFLVETAYCGVHEARAVIVATGASPRPLAVTGADRLTNYGVGYSTLTHAPLLAGRSVAVVGTTFRALRGAVEMAHSAGHVYVIASQSDRLVTPLARALRRYPNVTFLEDVVVREVRGAANVEAIVLEQHGEERVIAVDAVFADVGLVPHSDMVLHLLQTAPGGFIWVNDHNATTLPGLFAAGDVTTVFVEQVLIAIGEGARAAASAYEYILSTLTPPVERSVGRAPDAGWY